MEASTRATLAALALLSSWRAAEALKNFPRIGRSSEVWEIKNDVLSPKRQAGLVQFPRIGRAGLASSWETDTGLPALLCPSCFGGQTADGALDDIALPRSFSSERIRGEAKRQGLIQFPRVGRSGPWALPGGAPALVLADAAAADANGNAGLWFGPHVGGRGRRPRPAGAAPWTLLALGEMPPLAAPSRAEDEVEEQEGAPEAAGGGRQARAAPGPAPAAPPPRT